MTSIIEWTASSRKYSCARPHISTIALTGVSFFYVCVDWRSLMRVKTSSRGTLRRIWAELLCLGFSIMHIALACLINRSWSTGSSRPCCIRRLIGRVVSLSDWRWVRVRISLIGRWMWICENVITLIRGLKIYRCLRKLLRHYHQSSCHSGVIQATTLTKSRHAKPS